MGKGMKHKRLRAINNHQQQSEIKINLNDCPFYKCPKCEKEAAFDRVEMIKFVSRLLTGQPYDTFIPRKMYRCIDCGYVLSHTGEPAPAPGT